MKEKEMAGPVRTEKHGPAVPRAVKLIDNNVDINLSFSTIPSRL
jgi:hypothetical protein